MILCGIDVETTGLEPGVSEITEIGYAIFDSDRPRKPLLIKSMLLDISGTVPLEIEELTGINDALLDYAGKPTLDALHELMNDLIEVDMMVAHNAPFDRSMLEAFCVGLKSPLIDKPWLDTRKDIPFPKTIRNRNLVALAAEHGFLNSFPHAAIFDVFTMMKILFCYDFEKVLAYRNEPTVYLKALVDFNNKELAKKRGFQWQEFDGRVVEKSWIKAVKQSEVDNEKVLASFTVQVI